MLLGNASVLAWVKVGVAILRAISDVMTRLLASIANVRVWKLITVIMCSTHEVAHSILAMAPLVAILATLRVLSGIAR